MNRGILAAAILAATAMQAGPLQAQQSNLQVLIPPTADLARPKTRDIAASWTSLHGDRAVLNALDIYLNFGDRTSSSTYRATSVGTALFGSLGDDTIRIGAQEKELAGITFHGGTTKYYHSLTEDGALPARSAFTSVPVSFGSFTIGEDADDLSTYNLLAGFQAGASLNLKSGNFAVSPLAMMSIMTGYAEKYEGGVYWSNRHSGLVKPFPVLTLAADILYLPGEARLGAIYQRSFSNGEDRALDSLTVQLTLGWSGWSRRLRKAADE